MAAGDDDRRTEMRHLEQPGRKIERQAHAAMRGRIARQIAGMQRDARPGQPVHVGHRRIVVGRGMVVLVLLQHHEHAGRRRVPRLAGRAGRDGYADAVAIDVHQLLRQRDDHRDRPGRLAIRMPGELAGLQVGDLLQHLLSDRLRRDQAHADSQPAGEKLTSVQISKPVHHSPPASSRRAPSNLCRSYPPDRGGDQCPWV